MANSSLSSEFGSSPPKLRISGVATPQEFRPPVAKNFSFSVASIWRSNGNLLRWITEVPSVHRDMALEPDQYHGEKHIIDFDEFHDGHEGVEHRDKRAKLYPTLGHHGSATLRRRDRIMQSTRNVARSVSSGFHHIFSSSQTHDQLDGSTLRGTGSIPSTPSAFAAAERLRFVFVGDSNCGKSCMLLRFYQDIFTSTWNPTQYELFNKRIHIDGKDANLELWDTSGHIELHQLQLLSYLSWDAVFLCFSVNSDKKFTHAQTKWIYETRMHCPGAPVFLVGLKKDTRIGSGKWAPLFTGFDTRISASEGAMAANSIGAVKYMECSAMTGEGVYRIFEEGVRIVRAIRSGYDDMPQTKTQGFGLGQLLCF